MQPSFSYYTTRFEIYRALRQLRHDIRNTMALTEVIRANPSLPSFRQKDLIQYRETLLEHLKRINGLLGKVAPAETDQTLTALLQELQTLCPPLQTLLQHLDTSDPMDPQRYTLEEDCLAVCDRLVDQIRCGRNPLEGLFYYKSSRYAPIPEDLQIKIPDPPDFEEPLANVAALIADAVFGCVSAAASGKSDSDVLLSGQRFLSITGQQQETCWQLTCKYSKTPDTPLLQKDLEHAEALAASQGWTLQWSDHRYTMQIFLSLPLK